MRQLHLLHWACCLHVAIRWDWVQGRPLAVAAHGENKIEHVSQVTALPVPY